MDARRAVRPGPEGRYASAPRLAPLPALRPAACLHTACTAGSWLRPRAISVCDCTERAARLGAGSLSRDPGRPSPVTCAQRQPSSAASVYSWATPPRGAWPR